MKKNSLTRLLFIVIASTLFSCAGESQQNDMVAAEPTESTKSEKDMSSEISRSLENKNIELTNEEQEAFQVRAIQKFKDFLDYIKIISDPKVDNNLKEHSSKLAVELFKNDSIKIYDTSITKSQQEMLISDYLTKIKTNKKPIIVHTNSIQFTKPITSDSLGNYSGIIEVSLKLKKKTLVKNISVHILNIKKSFGDEEQIINEVRLGNIY